MSARRPKGCATNVRARWSTASFTLLALVLALPFSARALDSAHVLTDLLSDPLQTLPEVMQAGAILPGESTPIPCPVHKNFATPLALGEAVDLALCNNPQIQVAWANIKVQAGAVGEARAAYLPTLSGAASRINDHIRFPGSGIDSSTIVSNTLYGTLTWRLFDFGGRAANREAANRVLAAALANHDAVLQKTLTAVIQAYFDAQTARAARQAKQLNETLAQRTLDTARRREAKGAGANSDTLQATTALAKVSLDKHRAEGAYHKAVSVLLYALGVPMQTQLTLADDLDVRTGQEAKDISAWLEEAQQKHPAIMAARARLEAAQEHVTATHSEGLPTLDLSANYYQNGRPGQPLTPTKIDERILGIALNIPIFEGFARTYKVRGAQAQVEQRYAELQDIEHQTLMEVVKAHADASAALRNLEASETLLKAAQESLGVSQRKYERGAADVLEILNTQTALSDAQHERIRCMADWRSARLRLLASAGLMGHAALAD